MEENDHELHEFFTQDHRRLDELFDRFKADKSDARIEILNEFASGLIRHIIWEEEYLFPIFERVTGMVQEGPVKVMREEHHIIQELLYELLMGVRLGEPSADITTKLDGLLLQHNLSEENVLYEAVENMLALESRNELLQILKDEEELDIEEWIDGVKIIEDNIEENPVSFHNSQAI